MNAGAYLYSYEEGAYAHAVLPMLMGQVGLIGLVVYIVFFILYGRLVARNYLIIYFPIFLIGLSYLHPF